MIVCINDIREILWLNEDDSIKQLPEHIDNDKIIVLEHIKETPKFNNIKNDNDIYVYKLSEDGQEILNVKIGEKPKPPITNEDLQKDTSTLLLAQVDQFEQGLATKQDIQAVMLALADIHMMLNTSREV